MRELGVQAYRFSVAWPRVLPHGRGAANERGMAFYDRLIDSLLAAGIEPWLCLYHSDLPQALDDLGGWTVRDSAGWFADYAALVARRYGDRVKRFATFNEPSIFTLFGYGLGGGAPGASSPATFHRAVHNVNLAHGAAVDVLRSLVPNASIGAIHNWQPCLPATPADADAAELLGSYWNAVFPDPQCLGMYPPRLAAIMEPYVQPGDLARICPVLATLTYRELAAAARQLAQGLLEREVVSGDRIALMLPTGRDFFVAFLGVLCAGAVPVPIYPPMRLAQLEEHLRRQAGILRNAGARMLVTVPEGRRLATLLQALVGSLTMVESVAGLLPHAAATGPLPQRTRRQRPSFNTRREAPAIRKELC
jgi:hypothetical protein